jgi:hypothetical protein
MFLKSIIIAIIGIYIIKYIIKRNKFFLLAVK